MSTKESPAHLASRGGLVEQNNDLWWHGPKWLSEPSAWPADITTTATPETLAEAKTTREVFKHATDQVVDAFDTVLHKYSLWRTLRITAWEARFVRDTRSPSLQRKRGPLTREDLNVQRRFWEKRAEQEGLQSEQFEKDRLQLILHLSDQQLLECRGQIQGACPLYLPDTAVYTKTFVQEAHEATLHGGLG